MNAIQAGQLQEAEDLGLDPSEVGCDCNSDSLVNRSLDFGVGFDDSVLRTDLIGHDDSVLRTDLVGFDDSVLRTDLVGETLHTDFVTGCNVGYDDSVMRADLVGAAKAKSARVQNLQNMLMNCQEENGRNRGILNRYRDMVLATANRPRVGFDNSVMRADLVGHDDSVLRTDLIGRSTAPHYSKALRRRLMSCRADCEQSLVGFDESILRTDLIGRSTVPHYSRALRRRLMSCRSDCERDLVGLVGETLHTDFVTGCVVNGCNIGADVEEDFWSSIVDEADLADLPDVVGFSFPNPFKAISRLAKGASRAVKSVPVMGAPFKAATSVLNSGINVLQKVLSNPFVSTFGGQFAVPANLLLATYKGGAKGALDLARKELHNPVRQMVIKGVALVFPPAAPAAVAYEAAQRVDSALRSKDPIAIAKAVAQVAATTALGETGDAGALKALDILKKVKAVADKVPVTALTPMLHSRAEVCGAKSEESRGLWLKSHIYREGDFLIMTIYSVANANAEVVNLKVDLVPIMKSVAAYHKKLHGGTAVSGLFDNLQKTALKLGRAQLANQAFSVSRNLAGKAACTMQTPAVPVSDLALTAYAAARKGVDAVEKSKVLKSAMEEVATNVNRLIQVKAHLAPMKPAIRAKALQDPTIKSAILKGIGSKFALAKFIKAGGPEKAKAIQKNAMLASKKFGALAAQAKAGNPDAKKMAAVVKIAAKTQAKTQHAVANNKGSAAGLVIDSKGKVHRNAKGFKKRGLKKGEKTQILIPPKGHGTPQTGMFDKVSGARPGHKAALVRRLLAIRHLARINGVTDPGHISQTLLEQAGYVDIEGVARDYHSCKKQLAAERAARRLLQYGPRRPFVSGEGGSAATPTRSDVRSPTRTDVRSPTRTRTEVRSPTSTSTEVRSPTSTSTEAYTQGNFTLTATGGAGAGATHVTVNLPGYPPPAPHMAQLSTPPPNGVFDHISDPRPASTGIFDHVKDEPGFDEDGNYVSGSSGVMSRTRLLHLLKNKHRYLQRIKPGVPFNDPDRLRVHRDIKHIERILARRIKVGAVDVPLDRRVYDLKTLYRDYLTQSLYDSGPDVTNAENDQLEYDTFVEDPFLEEEVPADLA